MRKCPRSAVWNSACHVSCHRPPLCVTLLGTRTVSYEVIRISNFLAYFSLPKKKKKKTLLLILVFGFVFFFPPLLNAAKSFFLRVYSIRTGASRVEMERPFPSRCFLLVSCLPLIAFAPYLQFLISRTF